MLYMANPCGLEVVAAMGDGRLGMIDTPYQGKAGAVRDAHAAGVTWCADNGCFTDAWDPDTWWAWLTNSTGHAGRCVFAAAPDVVGDAAATHHRATPWLPRIRALGYPVAYVAQDGLHPANVPWDDIDALFLGGTTAWKLGPHARALTYAATDRRKWVHMGRVNSRRRYRYAAAIGCDSVDGTYLTFGPDTNLPKLLSWARTTDQGVLFPWPRERGPHDGP